MSRLRKIFFHGGLHFISISVEEGIMFPPNSMVREVLLKSMAQAMNMYYVEICAVYISTTHVHMVVRVVDPADLVNFIKVFKCESAHGINRLLGRKKRTVWCEGYDSPIIDDIETITDKIAYILGNAAKDGFVDTIEDYPGFNTFYCIKQQSERGEVNKRYKVKTYKLSRRDFKVLPKGNVNYDKERDKLVKDKKEVYLDIHPNAWMKRFGITSKEEVEKLNKDIIQKIKRIEDEAREERKKLKKGVIGKAKLKTIPIGAHYIPNRKGKRMLVHSVDKEKRKKMISWIKQLIDEAKKVYQRWKQGDYSLPWPMGLFPPGGIRTVEPIGW